MILYSQNILAAELVTVLRGKTVVSDAHPGLFLAAPCRTGKSTFLQNDLLPALPQQSIAGDIWRPTDTHQDLFQ